MVTITLRGKIVSLLRCPPSSPNRTPGYKSFAPWIGFLRPLRPSHFVVADSELPFLLNDLPPLVSNFLSSPISHWIQIMMFSSFILPSSAMVATGIILFLCPTAFAAPSTNSKRDVWAPKLISPAAGDVLVGGSDYTIKWCVHLVQFISYIGDVIHS